MLNQLLDNCMPARQRHYLSFAKRCSIIDRGNTLLFVCEQCLYYDWIDAGIVQPRRECSAQIVQPPRGHGKSRLLKFGVQSLLAVAKSREACFPPAENAA